VNESPDRHEQLVLLLTSLMVDADLHEPNSIRDRHATLLDLASVRRRSAGDQKTQRLAALRQLIKDAAGNIDDNVTDEINLRRAVTKPDKKPGPALLAQFGLRPGTRRMTMAQKKEVAAAAYGRSVKTLSRDLPTLISILAAEIEMIEDTEERREARDRIERDEPVRPSLAVDWMDRMQAYYRIWSSVAGIQGDLIIALKMRRDSVEEATYIDRLHIALWHWVEFSLKLDRFMEEYGGVWLLTDDEDEERVATAISHIWRHPPFNDRMHSQLRKVGRDAKGEYDDFLLIIETNPLVQDLAERWRKWFEGCSCELDKPDTDCEVHELLDDCQVYIDLIDRDFDRLVPWYRRKSRVRPFATEDIIERYGYYGEKKPIDEQASGSQYS
jgi:hypothetical protein